MKGAERLLFLVFLMFVALHICYPLLVTPFRIVHHLPQLSLPFLSSQLPGLTENDHILVSTQIPCPKRQTKLISTSFSKLEARECLMLTLSVALHILQFSRVPPLRISSDCKHWPKLGEDVWQIPCYAVDCRESE